MKSTPPLQPGRYYHIYNRGNNRENLFREERNYRYFLGLYDRHISPIAETFAYCLLCNHFHFLVRIGEPALVPETTPAASVLKPSQAFSNCFNAYAKAINKAYGRTGSLFEDRFGRIEVTTEAYFARLVVYIHRNPQKHGFVADFRDWPWSSYHALAGTSTTRLNRSAVLSWFGNQVGFHALHQADHPEDLTGLRDL
jgi:putative transposase